jgi:hypothetical protein
MEKTEFSVAETVQETGYAPARIYQLIKRNQIAFRKVKVCHDEFRIPRAIVEELKDRKAACRRVAGLRRVLGRRA